MVEATLWNGAKHPKPRVDSIMVSLNTLWDQNAAAVIELVEAEGDIGVLGAMAIEHAKRFYLVTPDGANFCKDVTDVLASAWDKDRRQLRNPVVSLTQK